ncbi:MAG: DEAD/DEAH box helicase, partial [Candidatus Methanospirareceae archaeon]
MNSFSLLRPRIQEVLKEIFVSPTKPQELAIPCILEGKDVLIIAPTGSGKTEAAILPVFHKILEYKSKNVLEERKGIFAIYITPLRALNRDLLSRLEKWCAELDIRIQVRHGDTARYERRKQALKPPDILITTPETIQAILPGERMRKNLKTVKHVIIDEVHELVGSKRGAQLSLALSRIAAISGNFQRICLSATVGNPEEVAKYFSGEKEVEIINIFSPKTLELKIISPEVTKQDEIKGKELSVEPDVISHIEAIREELKRNKSSLIFVNTRRAAEMIGSLMKKMGIDLIEVHHGSLSKEARIEAEEKLKSGEIKGLICTSSMELGIDIGSIDMVIQYASPRQVTKIVQRVGRASHFIENTSRGKIIALSGDDIAESLIIAKRAKFGEIERIRLKERSLDVLANQICGILLDFGYISFEKLHTLVKSAHPFRNISLEDIKRVAEQLEKEGLVRREEGGLSRSRSTRMYYYDNLSMIPDERKYEVYDIVTSKKICALDETFVMKFASPEALFVAKGEIWKIVDIEPDKIKVEPCSDKKGEIPNWEGEEIPVPFEVAQEVGALRDRIALEISSRREEEIEEEILKDLNLGGEEVKGCVRKVIRCIKEQIEAGYPVPTDKHVVIEVVEGGKEVIINACFGHLVNEALGRLFTSLLGAKLGTDVLIEIDPYRIRLKADRGVKKGEIEEIFTIKPE